MRLKAVVQRELIDFGETWNPHTCVRRLVTDFRVN